MSKKVLMPCRLVPEEHVQKGVDAMSISTRGVITLVVVGIKVVVVVLVLVLVFIEHT